MKKNYLFLTAACLILLLNACKKENDVFSTITLDSYYPLQTGKYITYQLDSLVYTNFGTQDTTISYEVKYQVDSLITDNLGRPAYRLFRFIRKSAPQPWVPSGTFMAVNSTSSVEFIENNLRYIKLKLPVKDGYLWKGNVFIDTYSLNSTLKYLDDWDYVYAGVGQPATVGGFSLDNTLTVQQRDEVIGDPSFPDSYSEINFGEEKYAQGIGLVYRKFFHSEFQPDPAPGYIADGSYGVTLTMIDHN